MAKPKKSKKAKTTEKTENPLKLFNFHIIIICLFSILAYVYIFDSKLDLNGDNVSYYLLGQSISHGNGFISIWNINAAPHNHFPIGYPAILAFFMLFSSNLIFLKILNLLFLLGSLILLYVLFKNIIPRKVIALCAVLVIAINPHLLRYSTIMMSEIPFLFFTTLALFFVSKVDINSVAYKQFPFYGLLFSLMASYYTRGLGLAIIFGVISYFIYKKKWHYTITTILGMAILYLPWYLRNRSFGRGSYISELLKINPYHPDLGLVGPLDLFNRFISNLVRYISIEIPSSIFPAGKMTFYQTTELGWLVGLLLLFAIIIGIIHLPKLKALISFYLIGTFGITLLWPEVWTGERFIMHLVPLFLFLSVFGLIVGIEFVSKKELPTNIIIVLILPFIFLSFSPLKEQHENATKTYPPQWSNYFKVAQWANQNTPPETRIVCRKGAFFYLFSQRKTASYRNTKDTNIVIQDMKDKDIDYVVLEQLGFGSTPKYLLPAITKNQALFTPVLRLQNPDTYLLKFQK